MSSYGLAIAAVAAIALTGHAATAQTFGVPAQLSFNDYPSDATAAIDGAGNALVFWFNRGAYVSSHRPGGQWSRPASVPAAVVPGATPVLRMDDSGRASLLSVSSAGIWVADRPVGGHWGRATKVVAESVLVGVQFLANARGDQALVFQEGVDATSRLVAVRRPAGAVAWGAPEIIVTALTAGNLVLASAAIGPGGDTLVTWQSFATFCGRRSCSDGNFVVHAAREQAGSGVWTESGNLTPGGERSVTAAAIDAGGRAVVLSSARYGSTVVSNTQASGGGAWSAPVTAFDAAGASVGLWAADSGANGAASFAVTTSGSSASVVTVVDGNLATNAWGPATNLAASDPRSDGLLVTAANASGGNVVEWTDLDGTERVAFRRAVTAPWSAPRILAGPGICAGQAPGCTVSSAAAISPSGHAVVLYVRTEASDGFRTLYAATE